MPVTTDRDDPNLRKTGPDGQQMAYLVLSEDERRKGFVRPVRTKYYHVGRTVCGKETTLEGHQGIYICVMEPGHAGECSHWSMKPTLREALERLAQGKLGGCDAETVMGLSIAETYSRDPGFYGATYCAKCRKHFPVGVHGEFIWDDGSRVGT